MKRKIEIIIALILLIISLPIILIISVISFFELKRFPFIIQTRGISLNHPKFKIIKIRTMRETNDNTHHEILNKYEYQRYVPKFCRYLRQTGIDELPQLLNVIKGEMKLFGPRPLVIKELEQMKRENLELYLRREKLNLTSGLSGYWQVFGERELGLKNLIELDEYYLRNKSLRLDIYLFLKSFLIVLKANHSDAITKKIKKESTKLDFEKIMPKASLWDI